jgi:hypothetical protein
MSHMSCSEESAVARAIRRGEWNESLEAHVRSCGTCRSVRQAAEWMQALAPESQLGAREQANLPDPQVLWLRAQLSERQAAAERAHQILQWVEVVCAMVICAGLGIWLVRDWSEVGGAIGDGMNWVLFEAWPALWNSLYAYGPANAPILFSSALAAIALVAVAITYPLLARE